MISGPTGLEIQWYPRLRSEIAASIEQDLPDSRYEDEMHVVRVGRKAGQIARDVAVVARFRQRRDAQDLVRPQLDEHNVGALHLFVVGRGSRHDELVERGRKPLAQAGGD